MPSYDDDGGFPQRPRRHRTQPAPWMLVLPAVVLLVLVGVVIGYLLF